MRKQYTTDNISFDDIVAYVFDEVSETEEQAIEDFLEEDNMYADLTDELLALNRQKGFRSKSELKTYLAQQQQETLHKFQIRQQASKKGKQIKRVVAIALLTSCLLAAFLAWFYYSTASTTFQAHEAQTELKKEQVLEQVKMNQASADNWLSYFQLGEFTKSLHDLSKEMEEATVIVPKSDYFRGLLTLYLHYQEPEKVVIAIQFLEKGQSYNLRRAMYQQIIAYTIAGQYEIAAQLLANSPWEKTDFPASIQNLWTRYLGN